MVLYDGCFYVVEKLYCLYIQYNTSCGIALDQRLSIDTTMYLYLVNTKYDLTYLIMLKNYEINLYQSFVATFFQSAMISHSEITVEILK